MHTIPLPGCTPTPLAAYLKALGLFRILSQQRPDSAPRAYWQGNTFILSSNLDREALRDFFCLHYAPSPILSPWNGDGGFFSDSRPAGRAALRTIEQSTAKRFSDYRTAIAALRSAITAIGINSCPEKGPEKNRLLLACRMYLPDEALAWFDSAVVLTIGDPKLPPLLGTGGNDGSMDFSNNHMQWLADLFGTTDESPPDITESLFESALYLVPCPNLSNATLGQFSPAASGGVNATSGFDSRGTINPWDFVLSLEGTLVFAAAAIKRLEGTEPGQLAYPFCVYPSGSGYGSAAFTDENDARCEIWMPLWQAPVSFPELQALLAEGRAQVGKRPAKNGVDFARAVASLGVDRGVSEFQRYGFHKRNGKSFYASPLQRLRVRRDSVTSDLLAASDGWIQHFCSKAKAEKTPRSVASSARRLEAAILAQCSSTQNSAPDKIQNLLLALGACERALARSPKWTKKESLKPLPPLSPAWIKAATTADPEYRLAAALASLGLWVNKQFFPIRRHLEPVKVVPGDSARADWDEDAADVVSSDGDATALLCAIMRRRLLLAQKLGGESWPEFARLSAWPSDIAAFIEGRFDDERFIHLLWALSLVDFRDKDGTPQLARPKSDETLPSAFYGQLKLCFAQRLPEDRKVPVTPSIFHLAASGDGARASEQALRRLHASGIPVAHVHIALSGQAAGRTAAALLFPLWHPDSGYSPLREACEPVARHLFSQPAHL